MRQAAASSTALLIIDMMNLFDFEGGAALAKSALACSKAIRRLRNRFDEAGAPVIYVNDNFSHWQGDFRELLSTCQTSPAPSSTIARQLAPRSGHYHLLKPKHSAFFGTPLAILLRQLGVRNLVLTGIAADSCILATATEANMQDLAIWVPADSVAAITRERKARALSLIKSSLGGEIRGSLAIRGLFPDGAIAVGTNFAPLCEMNNSGSPCDCLFTSPSAYEFFARLRHMRRQAQLAVGWTASPHMKKDFRHGEPESEQPEPEPETGPAEAAGSGQGQATGHQRP